MLGAAIESGVNWIDTADSYEDGYAEKLLGEILVDFKRNQFVICSKCFFPTSTAKQGGLSDAHINEAFDGSQARLKVAYLDVYFAHRYDPDVAVESVAESFNRLISESKIRSWGICKWPIEKAVELLNYCANQKLAPPIAQQFQYNLFNREAEFLSFPLFESNQLPTISYSPLAQGVLTGKYFKNGHNNTRADDPHTRKTMWDMDTSKIQKVEQWKQDIQALGVTPTTAALAFCLNQKAISRVLIGAKNKQQLTENLKASKITWDNRILEVFDAM